MYEITVKRPNGEIEKVMNDKFAVINDTLFGKMKEATSAAGKGELLSYKYVDGRTDAEKELFAINEKITGTEIALAKARDFDPQTAIRLRDELEALKEQRRNLK
jgi:hypothetical protein